MLLDMTLCIKKEGKRELSTSAAASSEVEMIRWKRDAHKTALGESARQ